MMHIFKEKIGRIQSLNHRFNIFFIVIVVFKLFLMLFFTSDYEKHLFMPFTQQFLTMLREGHGYNVYQYFYTVTAENLFPYPPLMLYIQGFFSFLIGLFRIEQTIFANFFFKFPILLFDIWGMMILNQLFPYKRKYIGLIYFLSPINVYAGYMHGQLDIIPTTLFLASLYYLLAQKKEKAPLFSAFILGCAISTKIHILAVIPFVLCYVNYRYGIKILGKYCLVTVLTVAMFVLPFLSEGFISSVLFPKEQGFLMQLYVDFGYVFVYIPVLIIIFFYFNALNLSNMNREVLLYFCGITFSLLLIMTPAMPGWYMWIVPYFTIYFIDVRTERKTSLWNYLLFNSVYLVYYIFLHQREYVDLYFMETPLLFLKFDRLLFRNVIYTILTGSLMYTTYQFFQNGLQANHVYRRKNRLFTIGIAGDSGAGKSSYIDIIMDSLGSDKVMYIEGDGDHRWERGSEHWQEYTQLNPKANYLYKQAEDVKNLRNGNKVRRVDYDHDTGRFTQEYLLPPRRFVVVCGLHAIYLPQMRKNLDLKIYLDTDETLRRFWKIERDTKRRGYSLERVMKQIEDRMDDAQKYIYPQKNYADLVIRYFDKNLHDCTVKDYVPRLDIEFTMSAELDVEAIINELRQNGVFVEYEFTDDLKWQKITVDGESLEMAKPDFEGIAERNIRYLEDISYGGLYRGTPLLNMARIFTLMLISYKMQNG